MTANTIDQNIRDLATKIKGDMKVGEAGIVEIPKDIFEKTLDETLSMDMVKKVQSHQANVVAATGLALGEVGLEAFKGNKTLNQVSVEYPVGKDSIGGTFSRSKQVPDGNGGQQTKFGALGMSYKVAGASGSKGSLKKVRAHLSDIAKDVLAE